MFDCAVSLVAGATEARLSIRDQHLLRQLPFLQDLISNTRETPDENKQGAIGILVFLGTSSKAHLCQYNFEFHIPVSYTHLTLPTKRIV